MKKIIYLSILFWGLLTSCEKEYKTYSGESGLYFDRLRVSANVSFKIPFGEHPDTERSTIEEFQVTLLGNVTDYDREFVFQARELTEIRYDINSKGDTLMTYYPAKESVDYVILDHPVIAAGTNKAIVRVQFNRTDLGATEREKMVDFVLKENQYFKNIFPINESGVDTQQVTCIINDKIGMPWWWWEDSYEDGIGIFGTYSKTKSMMICTKYGINRKSWVEGTILELGGAGRLRFIAIDFQTYLNEQEVPIMDEPDKDGNPVVMVMGEKTLDNM